MLITFSFFCRIFVVPFLIFLGGDIWLRVKLYSPIHTPDPNQNAGDPDWSMRLEQRGPIHTLNFDATPYYLCIYIYINILAYAFSMAFPSSWTPRYGMPFIKGQRTTSAQMDTPLEHHVRWRSQLPPIYILRIWVKINQGTTSPT